MRTEANTKEAVAYCHALHRCIRGAGLCCHNCRQGVLRAASAPCHQLPAAPRCSFPLPRSPSAACCQCGYQVHPECESQMPPAPPYLEYPDPPLLADSCLSRPGVHPDGLHRPRGRSAAPGVTDSPGPRASAVDAERTRDSTEGPDDHRGTPWVAPPAPHARNWVQGAPIPGVFRRRRWVSQGARDFLWLTHVRYHGGSSRPADRHPAL